MSVTLNYKNKKIQLPRQQASGQILYLASGYRINY